MLKSESGESFLSQMATGFETSALSGHEQEPLQQSLWDCQWLFLQVWGIQLDRPTSSGWCVPCQKWTER